MELMVGGVGARRGLTLMCHMPRRQDAKSHRPVRTANPSASPNNGGTCVIDNWQVGDHVFMIIPHFEDSSLAFVLLEETSLQC